MLSSLANKTVYNKNNQHKYTNASLVLIQCISLSCPFFVVVILIVTALRPLSCRMAIVNTPTDWLAESSNLAVSRSKYANEREYVFT